MAFQDDVCLYPLCQVAGLRQPFEAVGRVAFQAVELLGVGCQDDVLRQLLNPGVVVAEHVDGVGIADDGALRAAQLCYHGDARLFGGTQPRADAHCLEVIGLDRLREGGLLAVYLQHGLRDAGLQDVDILLGRVDRHLAGACTQTSLCGQDGGTSHTIAAGNEQGVAHRPFVRERIAAQDTRTDVALLEHGVVGLGLVDALLAEPDVEHAQLA